MGMKRFSLQHPQTRQFIHEWLFLQALADEGMISLRYKFVEVIINGKSHGIYALEEHFGKHALEHSGYREGPIVGYSKDIWVQEYRRRNRSGIPVYNLDGSFLSARIDGSETGSIVRHSLAEENFIKATSLLEAFRLKTMKASEVFDVQKLAFSMALHVLFASDEFDWKDMKFYLNPFTSKLEPIGKEIHSGKSVRIPSWWLNDGYRPYQMAFINRLFNDYLFVEAYVQALKRVAAKDYFDALINKCDAELNKNLNIIATEFPNYRFSKRFFYNNQTRIRALLKPIKTIHAYVESVDEKQLLLEVGNLQHFPVEILHVFVGDDLTLTPKKRMIVSGKKAADPVKYKELAFEGGKTIRNAHSKEKPIRISFQLLGSGNEQSLDVIPVKRFSKAMIETDLKLKRSSFRDRPFLDISDSMKEIHFVHGDWSIKKNLVIPPGFVVYGHAGLRLNLRDSATIITYSPLYLLGSKDRPITIDSTHGGHGVVVVQADGKSFIKQVRFSGLSAPVYPGWSLTGAITFYESDVEISGTLFESNRDGDDFLNIVRSKFTVRNCTFKSVYLDAIDVDFSTGSVASTTFDQVGNDAIDVSGSYVNLDRIAINSAGDKAFSFGEASVANVTQAIIRGAYIGIASKDLSKIQVNGLSLLDSKIGLSSYQKKSEYGPGYLQVRSVKTKNVSNPYLVEDESLLTIDGRKMASNSKNLSKTLYDSQ